MMEVKIEGLSLDNFSADAAMDIQKVEVDDTNDEPEAEDALTLEVWND